MVELYDKITTTRLTSEIISSIRDILKPYTFEELLEFMQYITTKGPVTEKKLAFVKAVRQEIKFKTPQK